MIESLVGRGAASVALAVLMLVGTPSRAAVRLPNVLGSGMVIQRDTDAAIWGWADPGEAVRVRASWSADATGEARADDRGRWRVILRTPRAGGPFTITVEGTNTITLGDVMSGDVWVCSGQSNMEWPLAASKDADRAVGQATHAGIRLYDVTNVTAATPRDDSPAQTLGSAPGWTACSPASAKGFSAVAYYFARELHESLGVPVGLIGSNWGGTPAEAWTSAVGLADFPEFAPALAKLGEPDAKPGPGTPASLYNGMIAPLTPMAIRGAIWYQGESNVGRAEQYARLFPAMIADWRRAFGREFPFYFVQIAPFAYKGDTGAAAELRVAQAAALALPQTGMVVTMDVGDPLDIHPRDKQTVGERLARLALHRTFGKTDVPCDGPEFASARAEGSGVRVVLRHAEGLESRGGPPEGFEVAGADGVFRKAAARVEGDAIVLNAEGVREPRAVRFGWGAASGSNVFNRAGLPLASFRAGVGE